VAWSFCIGNLIVMGQFTENQHRRGCQEKVAWCGTARTSSIGFHLFDEEYHGKFIIDA
jgi:hypothetical protein